MANQVSVPADPRAPRITSSQIVDGQAQVFGGQIRPAECRNHLLVLIKAGSVMLRASDWKRARLGRSELRANSKNGTAAQG